ncbi:MAG TPA: hypothetical protein VK988_13690, partial [Acidimicrobiales bacterium]|nr:hypothetical protein [Acidimicrobiales bacterium]
VPRQGPKVVALLRGGKASLRAQLAREFFTRTGKAAPQQALADALLVIEGMAQDNDEEELHLRVAQHEGATWLDLGDHTGRAVRITGAGWTVEDEAPVLFKRTALNAALPTPARGGSLDHLWRWLNVTAEDRTLVAAWLVSVLTEAVPHPILGLLGEQGTAKTTSEKVIVSALDPGPAPTRKPPRDGEAWITAAAGSWVVGIDNVSHIPDWLSDSLCRAVTGDGDVRRKLYTDGDHHVISFRRCIAITGIDLGAVRGDLAERLLPIDLDRIADDDRLEEGEMWPRWQQDHPLILGALLDLAAGVNHVLPSVRLERKPRMADYARVLASVDAVLGTSGLARYWTKQGTLASESLTGDPFITALAGQNEFEGSSAELLDLLTPEDERWRAPKGWPTNARAVTQLLRRQAPPMRKAGWSVTDDDGANKNGVVRWAIARPEKSRIASPPGPPPLPSEHQAGQAGQAGHGCETSQDDEGKVVDDTRTMGRLLAAFPGSEAMAEGQESPGGTGVTQPPVPTLPCHT